jgi:hypothetical protein
MARSDDQVETYGVAQVPGFARRTAINLLGRVNRGLNELTDGTVRSVDAVMGAAIGPYRKSRFTRRQACVRTWSSEATFPIWSFPITAGSR